MDFSNLECNFCSRIFTLSPEQQEHLNTPQMQKLFNEMGGNKRISIMDFGDFLFPKRLPVYTCLECIALREETYFSDLELEG